MVDSSRPVLYINVVRESMKHTVTHTCNHRHAHKCQLTLSSLSLSSVKDASAAIKEGVEKTVAEKMEKRRLLPEKLKQRLAGLASKLATDMVSAGKIAEKMAPKLCEEMPGKMKEKGLTVEVEVVFQEGPFFVLQMQVVHVDTVAMAEGGTAEKTRDDAGQEEEEDSSSSSSMSVWFMKQFYGVIGTKNQESLETGYLPGFIQSKLESSMGEQMTAEMAERAWRRKPRFSPRHCRLGSSFRCCSRFERKQKKQRRARDRWPSFRERDKFCFIVNNVRLYFVCLRTPRTRQDRQVLGIVRLKLDR